MIVVANACHDLLGIARAKCIGVGLLFVAGALDPVSDAQLQAPIGPELPLQRCRLLEEKGIVRSGIDCVVEALVRIEIRVGIPGGDRALAGGVSTFAGGQLVLRRASRSELGAQRC